MLPADGVHAALRPRNAEPGWLSQEGSTRLASKQHASHGGSSRSPAATRRCNNRLCLSHAGPVGTRHVQIGGMLVPCAERPRSHGSHAAAGQAVPVPSLEDSLSAAALALCQGKPLLLEGPPGAPAWQLLLHAEALAAATVWSFCALLYSNLLRERTELLSRHVPSVLCQGHACCRYWRVCPAACGSLPCVCPAAHPHQLPDSTCLPAGAGKSALLQELARLTGNLDLMTVHMDDQMDSKTLLGAYVCTTRPGEFVWQPGPLTQVSSDGHTRPNRVTLCSSRGPTCDAAGVRVVGTKAAKAGWPQRTC